MLLLGTEGGCVQLWDASSFKSLAEVKEHGGKFCGRGTECFFMNYANTLCLCGLNHRSDQSRYIRSPFATQKLCYTIFQYFYLIKVNRQQ